MMVPENVVKQIQQSIKIHEATLAIDSILTDIDQEKAYFPYSVAQSILQRINLLHEKMEHILCMSPDYPDYEGGEND